MKAINQIKDLTWYWREKPVKLTEMHQKQLNVVKQTLINSKNNYWFNLHKDYWLNSIKTVEEANQLADKTLNKIGIIT
jgi:hypothetical protein